MSIWDIPEDIPSICRNDPEKISLNEFEVYVVTFNWTAQILKGMDGLLT